MSGKESEPHHPRYSLRARSKPSADTKAQHSIPPNSAYKFHQTAKSTSSGPLVASDNEGNTSASNQVSSVKMASAHGTFAAPKPITGKRKRGLSLYAGNVSNTNEKLDKESTGFDAVSTEETIRFDEVAFSTFLRQVEHSSRCCKCHIQLLKEPFVDSHVECWSSIVARFPAASLSALPCPTLACNGTTCVGCGKNPSEGDKTFMNTCCHRGWYAALWMVLSYFDSKRGRSNNTESTGTDRPIKPHKAKKVKSKTRRGPNPKPPAGTGYSENFHEGLWNQASSTTQAIFQGKHELQDEDREVRVLELLTNLLKHKPLASPWDEVAPTRKSKKQKDSKKAASGSSRSSCPITYMFHWSELLKVVAELFRAGSLQEANEHSRLYLAALDLVEAMVKDDDLGKLVKERTFDAFRLSSHSCRGCILPVIATRNDDDSPTFADLEGMSISSALIDLVEAAGGQMEAAATMPAVFDDKGSRDMLLFCKRIHAVGDLLGYPKKGPCPGVKDPTSEEIPVQFAMVEDAEFKKSFRYAEQSAAFRAASVPKRMRTLFHEMGVLRTALPQGIFVRVGADRPDMLKVIIVGPEGTPYEGGLFEFHLLCPEDYPNSPPSVTCATASRREAIRFHLNPNLYNSGYVCLSLIGTWHGSPDESWQPGRSTLLQVLISIQSMILGTATPADNEPGGLSIPHKEYNKGVQAGTISGAMLSWLQVAEHRDGVWKDVVRHHFTLNAAKIVQTAKSWAKSNDRITKHVDNYPNSPPDFFDNLVGPEDYSSGEDEGTNGAKGAASSSVNGAAANPAAHSLHAGGPGPQISPYLGGLGGYAPFTQPAPPLPPPPAPLPAAFQSGPSSTGMTAKCKSAERPPQKITNLFEELEKALREFSR